MLNETAVFGGGCFWCVEAVFKRIEGVISAVSGYAGGTRENPTYEQVCTGRTGHAEVVMVTFDPERIDYDGLLDVFFSAHDPTTEDRQGADVGSQYRSVIFYTGAAQRDAAERKIAEIDASGIHANRVVTQVVPFEKFWPAEEYHQDYYDTHPYAGYCRVVIAPKLKKVGLDVDALTK
jgi:peptide-methionine (S)-S-oxide reductase